MYMFILYGPFINVIVYFIGASMDTESVMGSVMGSVITDRKLRIAEVTVARESDLGVNDTQFVCISHLGNILREGDVVLG